MVINNKSRVFITLLTLGLSIISFINSSNTNPIYLLFYLFPLLYVIYFNEMYKRQVVFASGLLMLLFVAFLRYVLLINLEFCFGFVNYSGVIYDNYDVFIAFALMLAEFLAVYFGTFYFNKLNIKSKVNKRRNNITDQYNLLPLVLIIIGMCVFFIDGSFLNSKNFIWNASKMHEISDQTQDSAVFYKLFEWGKYFFICFSLVFLYHTKRLGYRLKCLLSFIILLLPCLQISGSSRLSVLMPLVAAYFMLHKFFFKNGRTLRLIFMSLSFVIISFLTIIKAYKVDSAKDISHVSTDIVASVSSLNAYFGGVHNVIVGVVSDSNPLLNRTQAFLADVFGNAMGISQLFSDYKGSPFVFNGTFYGSKSVFLNSIDQIVPTSIQNLFYFGGLPIFTLLMIYVIMKLDYIFVSTESIYLSYICAITAVLIGFQFPGNITHLFSSFWNSLLPILLLLSLNNFLKIKLTL